MRHPSRLIGLAAAAIVVVAATACGSSSPKSEQAPKTSATTSGALGTAQVVALSVPNTVECHGLTSATVPVTYETAGAEKRELYVDGAQIADVPASGTLTVDVHCDPLPHTFVVIAYDARGRPSAKEVKGMTNL